MNRWDEVLLLEAMLRRRSRRAWSSDMLARKDAAALTLFRHWEAAGLATAGTRRWRGDARGRPTAKLRSGLLAEKRLAFLKTLDQIDGMLRVFKLPHRSRITEARDGWAVVGVPGAGAIHVRPEHVERLPELLRSLLSLPAKQTDSPRTLFRLITSGVR